MTLMINGVNWQAEILSEKSQREALEGRLKHEKELLEDVLHREMERASALQAELQQAQQAKVGHLSCILIP